MKKILAIDDQPDNLVTIEAVIKGNLPGCEVITSLSGDEGLKLAMEEQPDVILLDIIMPKMDGFDVCKRLKADESMKHIPVVMITAIKTDSESRVKGLNIGADAFLNKPIDHSELTAQVNVMLRIKEAEDKLRAEKEMLNEKVKERTKELRKALVDATESDRLKSAFLATMSHELRTPLNAIIGFSDLITEELPVEEMIRFSKTVNTSGIHLLSLVEDLFDITLIESGETRVRKQEENLHSILQNVYDIILAEQQQMNKENIELTLVLPPEDTNMIIYTDQAKLKQILVNLLRNALKFTHKGSIRFGYLTSPVQGDEALEFFVEDTGIGVLEEKQEFIFDVFRQVEDSHTREYGGTGVGLSIAQSLTALLGGNISVTSEVGKGSTFSFTIPLNGIEESEKSQVNQRSKGDNLEGNTVLIVEDVESSFDFLEVLMTKAGIESIWAKDGLEAIKMCRENTNIDLVLMDINMPEMNGHDATKKIKESYPGLPIIAQTAYAVAGDKEKSLAAGCDDYISKPIKRELLMSIIEKWLNL